MRPALTLLALLFAAGCSKIAALAGPSGSCKGPQAYAAGATVSGKLGENECNGPGSLNGHLFVVSAADQTNFLITLTPSGFKGALGMWTADKKNIFEANGSGAVSAKVFLPAGSYTIVAARQNSEGGSYTLTTPATEVDGCTPPYIWTLAGAVIHGSLKNSDCGVLSNSRSDGYEIKLSAGQVLTATASADQLVNVGIRPEGANGVNVVVAKGGSATATFTAPTTANYIVYVGNTGSGPMPIAYTLTIH